MRIHDGLPEACGELVDFGDDDGGVFVREEIEASGGDIFRDTDLRDAGDFQAVGEFVVILEDSDVCHREIVFEVIDTAEHARVDGELLRERAEHVGPVGVAGVIEEDLHRGFDQRELYHERLEVAFVECRSEDEDDGAVFRGEIEAFEDFVVCL